jgi:methionyl-tRNA formyltransferase
MKIVVVTQASPFYLAESIDYFLANLPPHSQVVGCILLAPSPFAKKEGTLRKMLSTLKIFGLEFFIHYALRFAVARVVPSRNVKHVLDKHGIPAIRLGRSINSKLSLKVIGEYDPDLLISIQSNAIFKKALINLPRKGCLNVHSALLPRYRGLMPTFWVMKNDEKETGVSVFLIDEGLDSGPILVQKRLEIGARTLDDLIRDTKRIGMEALIEAVDLVESGDYTLIDNDDSLQTYFSFPTREDVREFRRKGKRFF